MSNVLVIAVHPDDETLGCGGTLLKHRAAGDALYWCIVTTPLLSQGYSESFIRSRDAQVSSVGQLFGFEKIYQLGLPTTALDQLPCASLVEALADVIKDCSPETLYIPFHADIHTDHQVACKAAMSCTKSFRFPTLRKIYMMETLSETEFAPPLTGKTFMANTFVDISDFMETKISIMEKYKGELGEHPFPRSIANLRALATLRGATSGCRYAESFMLIREVC